MLNEIRGGSVNRERAVARLNNGNLLKGYMKEFSSDMTEIAVEEDGTGKLHLLRMEDMKAVFFVKSFEGDHEYRERKSYSNSKPRGQRVFVKFRDGESLVGFMDSDIPWEKGFFLSKRDNDKKGFFLLPADEDGNNLRVFVVSSSVDDVTIVPGQAEQP
jgi:hypothetical protein